MKRWKNLLAATALTLSVGATLVPAAGVSAVDIISQGCKGNADSTVCKSKNDNAPDMIEIVINTLFFVVGMVAVIMIIVGGIRYASSGGDAGSLKGAKDTILYAIVGLVVVLLSYAIVNFVLGWFLD